jgi:hypothetical protein
LLVIAKRIQREHESTLISTNSDKRKLVTISVLT